MVITGFRTDTRASGCVIIDGDGARIASLPVEVLRELKLEVGLELSPAQQERVLRASSVEGARRVAVRLLATRPRAVEDLKRRLRDRGHDATAIAEAVDQLQGTGLLDDVEFARHYVRIRGPKGHGPSRLIHDLLTAGVERPVAERAVRDVGEVEGIDVLGAARKLAERRVAQLQELPPGHRRRRLLIYLARRGFRGREVREMVADLVAPRRDGQTDRRADGQ